MKIFIFSFVALCFSPFVFASHVITFANGFAYPVRVAVYGSQSDYTFFVAPNSVGSSGFVPFDMTVFEVEVADLSGSTLGYTDYSYSATDAVLNFSLPNPSDVSSLYASGGPPLGSVSWDLAWQVLAIGCGMVVAPFTLSMALRAVRRGLNTNLPLS